jgi:hypothetical protein
VYCTLLISVLSFYLWLFELFLVPVLIFYWLILGGSLFLFDRKVLRYFRRDNHNWRKKKDGKTVKEAHEKKYEASILIPYSIFLWMTISNWWNACSFLLVCTFVVTRIYLCPLIPGFFSFSLFWAFMFWIAQCTTLILCSCVRALFGDSEPKEWILVFLTRSLSSLSVLMPGQLPSPEYICLLFQLVQIRLASFTQTFALYEGWKFRCTALLLCPWRG